MHQIESPLHQLDEQAPLDVEIIEQVEDKSFEEIIKEKDEEILELREIFSIANSQIIFLQQENF